MRKRTIALLFLLIIIISYTNEIIKEEKKKEISIEKTKAVISNYYIYGTKLNIEGFLTNINPNFIRGDIIFKNKSKTIIYKLNYTKGINKIYYNISKEINNGIILDNIPKGTYQVLIRLTYKNKEKEKIKHFSLKNKTPYKRTTYYTLSKINNKINIIANNEFLINIKNNKENAYDIVIDPSKGGIDKGGIGNGYTESQITMDFANAIKTNLESKGIKVKLTRTNNSLKDNEYLKEYNKHGRAIIPHETHAKYVFSLHTNSSFSQKANGVSIYTPIDINYDFSTSIVENIVKNTKLKTDSSNNYSIDYGIYSHNYTKKEIEESKKEYLNKGYKMYNITQKSNYLYMIRETGGIVTGAYIDNRNKEIGNNPYYNSNIGSESYIIYLGYITNKNDINILTNHQEEYANIISNSIIKELKY